MTFKNTTSDELVYEMSEMIAIEHHGGRIDKKRYGLLFREFKRRINSGTPYKASNELLAEIAPMFLEGGEYDRGV